MQRRIEEERLKKLARRIDALAEKDDRLIRKTREIAELRKGAAMQLHSICRGFVERVNSHLSRTSLDFSPPDYSPESFRNTGANLLQINVRGRILQIEFNATETLVSTENFRVPYIVEGAVRSFNQDYLDRDIVEEQLLFFCLERRANLWRFFDARTYRTGLFDSEYLAALMDQMV
ncbi:MAG: hypothetical protein WD696_19785 [Bryobacteraceae bacterium]